MADKKEEHVSFEIAKLLREKGFDEHTICRYVDDNGATEKWYDDYREKVLRFELNAGDLIEPSIEPKEKYELYGDTIPAPTFYEVMEWLRKKYKLFLGVGFGNDDKGEFLYMVDIYDLTSEAIEGKYKPIVEADDYLTINPKTPAEAIEEALKYLLKKSDLIQNN